MLIPNARLGYVLSAIFICSEYQRLGIRFRQFRILRLSFWIKLAFIIVEVVLAVGTSQLASISSLNKADQISAFGVCLYKKIRSAGAILEWSTYTFLRPILPCMATED